VEATTGEGGGPTGETTTTDGKTAAFGSSGTSSGMTATAPTATSQLLLPIEGMDVEQVRGGFFEGRRGHRHDAVDVLAARNTPIHAVQAGTIAKLFRSRQGGLTIYQFEPAGRLCYYYAHLERYSANLREGDTVSPGQVIGYVGTSGNAPPNTPHLHFAVFLLGADRRWWTGTPIDPYPLLKQARPGIE
jgi:murein DD-endopeptidase MepM/ murein hydrolase activator NlpD